MKYTAQHILDFHAGLIPHPCGFYIYDFWNTPDGFWDERHDFIQWLFPNTEPSKAQPDTPYLPDVNDYRLVDKSKGELHLSRFFKYLERNKAFCAGFDTHNDLRVTRAIKFCSLVNMAGLEEWESFPLAVAVFWKVMKLVGGRKSWDTVKYWHEACEGWRLLPKVADFS